MTYEGEGLIRNPRWPRPIPEYGTEGLAGTPLPREHIEQLAESVTTVNGIMLDLIQLARELRADGHDAVAYQAETFSIDLEMAVEWEFSTEEVVRPMERVARVVNNTWTC